MAPPVKNCSSTAQGCKPVLGSNPSPKPAKLSPFIQRPLDTFSLDTATIFDPNFRWPTAPKKPPRLGDLSTEDLQRMAWYYHERQADQDPEILKQRKFTYQMYRFAEGKVPGEIYPLDVYGKDLPPFITKDLPPELTAYPANAAYTMAWDGDRAIVQIFEIPSDGSTIRIIENPYDGNLYLMRESNNVHGAIACWENEVPVVSASDDDSFFSWPFDLTATEAMLGGSMFMLGTTTQGNTAVRHAPSSNTSFGNRMRAGMYSTGLFLGLAYVTHRMGVPQDLAPYMEVGAGLSLLLGTEKLAPFFGRSVNIPLGGMMRSAPYFYIGTLGASYAWQAAGLKPGSLKHTGATITTSMMGYQLAKHGISRLPANSALAQAIAASSKPAKAAKLGLRTRMLVGGIRAIRMVGLIGLIDWILSGVLIVHDHATGRVKDPDHKFTEKLARETLSQVCKPGQCNWLGKFGNNTLPYVNILTSGAWNFLRRVGLQKILPWETGWEADMKDRLNAKVDLANNWAQDINGQLLNLAIGLVLAGNVDPKMVVQSHKGSAYLEALDMKAAQVALKEFFNNPSIKKYTDAAREQIIDLKGTKHKSRLHPDTLVLWNALSAWDGKIHDAKALRKHMMELLTREASRLDDYQPRLTRDKDGRLVRAPRRNSLAMLVKKELVKWRVAYLAARKKVGLADDTVLKRGTLTAEQNNFLFGGRGITVMVENHQITTSDIMPAEIFFRKRIGALEHMLRVLKESAKDKNSYPYFAWHFQKAK